LLLVVVQVVRGVVVVVVRVVYCIMEPILQQSILTDLLYN
jgi:hypothetical protein